MTLTLSVKTLLQYQSGHFITLLGCTTFRLSENFITFSGDYGIIGCYRHCTLVQSHVPQRLQNRSRIRRGTGQYCILHMHFLFYYIRHRIFFQSPAALSGIMWAYSSTVSCIPLCYYWSWRKWKGSFDVRLMCVTCARRSWWRPATVGVHSPDKLNISMVVLVKRT